ncbi:MAG: porin [Thiohalobacteraceae bacterium]
MDKKILSTAIAGVLAGSMAFAANADVTLYGQLDVSVDSTDIDGAGDDVNMNSNFSAIGVKGSEDLGNGLKAIFMVEFQTDLTEGGGSGGVSGRDRWVGLEGGFGKVRFGAMSTTYKATGAMIDPLWRTAFDTRNGGLVSALHGGNGDDGQGRTSNAIAYDTPSFGGFSAAATYSFDDDCSAATASCTNPDDDTYSVGARYKNGPVLAFVDYVTNDQGGSDDAWKVGGKFNFGDFAVFGQYEFDGGLISTGAGLNPGNTIEDADVWTLGGSFTMGNIMLTASYAQSDDDNDPTFNAEYDAWRIAGAYNFSKRTMMYAGFNQIDAEDDGEMDHFAVGMRHKF